MDEHAFDELERQAKHVRRVIEVDMDTKSVATPLAPETRRAIGHLTARLARHIGDDDADWAVTRWRITKQPLRHCIEVQLAEGPFRV